MSSYKAKRGSALMEFTLAGIMLIFVWISIVQIAIGMWRYSTLQYATKLAGSYSSVHGAGCWQPGYSCSIKIQDAAQIIRANAPGLDPTVTNLVFSAISPTDHSTVLASHPCRLDSCLTDTAWWPLPPYGAANQELRIEVDYLYRPGIAMWVPGAGGVIFGTAHLPGRTHQIIQF